jgi:hypothetical protein
MAIQSYLRWRDCVWLIQQTKEVEMAVATRGQWQKEKDAGTWWCLDPDVAIGAGEEAVEFIPPDALPAAAQEPGHPSEE